MNPKHDPPPIQSEGAPIGIEVPASFANKYADLIAIWNQRKELCHTCPTPCAPLPKFTKPESVCPLPQPRWGKIADNTRGLGDYLEHALHPVAVAFKLRCLDDNGKLKPDSGCAKRRGGLNNVGRTLQRIITKIAHPNAG